MFTRGNQNECGHCGANNGGVTRETDEGWDGQVFAIWLCNDRNACYASYDEKCKAEEQERNLVRIEREADEINPRAYIEARYVDDSTLELKHKDGTTVNTPSREYWYPLVELAAAA